MRTVDPIEALLGRRSARPRIQPEEVDRAASETLGIDGVRTLIDSGLLCCPARNEREYQTRVTVEPGPEEAPLFKALSQWGPRGKVSSQKKVIYVGDSLSEAVQHANEMIEKKLRREYTAKKPGETSRIPLAMAISALKNLQS